MSQKKPKAKRELHHIEKWAFAIIEGVGGLHDFERHEMAVSVFPRDVSVVLWALRCLTNPDNDAAGTVLEAIEMERTRRRLAKTAASGEAAG